MSKIKCMVCGKELHKITHFHLNLHNLSMKEYREKYPDAPLTSEEFRKKCSDVQKKYSREHPEKIIRGEKHYLYGKHPSQETRDKFSKNSRMKRPEEAKKHSEIIKGRKFTEKHKENIASSLTNYYKEHPELLKGENNPMYGKHQSEKSKKKNSESNKRNWTDDKFIEMMKIAWKRKPTKPEKELNNILKTLLPNEYIYNGDFKAGITIGGKCPDFVNINGKKKLIEFNGCYHHNCPLCFPEGGINKGINGIEESNRRIELFKEYGYTTLIIWSHEMEDIKKVINKILKFHDLLYISCSKQLNFEEMEELRK